MSEELSLIANLLENPKILPLVSKITPEDFDDEFLGAVYRELKEGKNILEIAKALDVYPEDIVKLLSESDTRPEFAVKSYGYYIFERNKNRKLKELAAAEVIDYAKMQAISQQQFFDEAKSNESDTFLQMVEDVYSGKDDELTIPTGFLNIDVKIGGFKKSEAIFIGGRPASGKTTFAINMAHDMVKRGVNVLFCSLEMAARELHERMVRSAANFSGSYKNLPSDEMARLIGISKAIKQLPLEIYDKAGMTIEDIYTKVMDRKPQIVFIDHLAILKSSQRFRSRYEEVSYLTAKIKQLARQYDIPVVCLCQLNRALEGREIKAPILSDIRDSGSVEQDGDIIAFIYRPEYHLLQQEPESEKQHIEWEEKLNAVKGRAKFIVAKNRRGYTGSFVLGFRGDLYKFYEL